MTLPEVYLGNKDVKETRAQLLTPNYGSGGYEADDRLDLKMILGLFLRRMRLFAITFALIFSAAVFITLTKPKVYTTHAEVVLNTRNENIAPEILDALNALPRGESEVSTELRILYSRELAASIVEEKDLIHDPDFNPLLQQRQGMISKIKAFFTDEEAPPAPAPTEEELQASKLQVIDILRSGLGAVRIGNAYSLRISYSHTNPLKAAEMANAYAQAYFNDQLAQKQNFNQRAASFLRLKIDELREQSQADIRQVQEYRIDNNMLSTTGATLTEQDISALNQQLALARAKSAEDAARLKTAEEQLASGSQGDDVGEALSSGVIQSLRAQRAGVSVRVAELSGRYGALHPELQKAQRELGDLDRQIQDEIDRVMSGLKAQARVSSQRVASLSRSLDDAKGELARNNSASVELEDLQRRAETSQQLYESYLNSYKEIVAREGIEEADARVLSEARVPLAPSRPRTFFNLVFGAFLGAGAGLALCFITELNFSGLTTGREVENALNVPFLGTIPSNRTVSPHADNVVNTLIKYGDSPMSEALSNLLTSVEFASDAKRAQVIYVTSSVPEEGKTTLSAALGAVAALRGEKTVVVDCDRQRRGLSRMFDVAGSVGLRDVLEGKAELDAALIEDPDTGCFILPIVRDFPKKMRLHKDGVFPSILAQLKERFDTIILDGAPILPIAEAREIAGFADYVLLAIRWRNTSRDAVSETIKLLPTRLRGSTGAVLTRANVKMQARFGGDQFYYYRKYKGYYASVEQSAA